MLSNLISGLRRLILSRLNLRSAQAAIKITPELLDQARTDPKAADSIVNALRSMVLGAYHHYNKGQLAVNFSEEELKDFVQNNWIHLVKKLFGDEGTAKWDPERGAVSTLVYTHIRNMMVDALQQSNRERARMGPGLDEPIPGEEGDIGTVGDTLEDISADDISEILESQQTLNSILDRLQRRNTSYPALLQAYLAAGGDYGEAVEILAEQGIEIKPARLRWLTQQQIRPIVTEVTGYERKRKPSPPSPVVDPVADITQEMVGEEEEEFDLSHLDPAKPAPVFRINPQTGERSKIGTGILALIKAKLGARDCQLLDCWLKCRGDRHKVAAELVTLGTRTSSIRVYKEMKANVKPAILATVGKYSGKHTFATINQTNDIWSDTVLIWLRSELYSGDDK